MKPVGRNEPCPCGSGSKYKNCCLAKEAGSQSDTEEVSQVKATAFKKMSDGLWMDAIEDFKSILDKTRQPTVALEAIAACYDGQEDYLMAAEFYEKALASGPTDRRVDNLYRLGVSRGCAGRFEKAKSAFEECLTLTKDVNQKEHIQQVIEQLESRKDDSESNFFLVQVQLQRAFTDLETEDYASASRRLENLLCVAPDNPSVLYNLGVCYSFMKRDDEALAVFEKVVELNPSIVAAYYNMGQIWLISKRDFSKALHCFNTAIMYRPDYVGAHHQKGIAYELIGDLEKAVECFKKTLELAPGTKMAEENLARVSASLQKNN